MDPRPIGKDVKVEVSSYLQKMWAHIRKFYDGHRTRFGVGLEKPEFDELWKKTKKTKVFQPETTVWRLSEQASVRFYKNSVTFAKRGRSVFLGREEYAKLLLQLPEMKECMDRGPDEEDDASSSSMAANTTKTTADENPATAALSVDESRKITQFCPTCATITRQKERPGGWTKCLGCKRRIAPMDDSSEEE